MRERILTRLAGSSPADDVSAAALARVPEGVADTLYTAPLIPAAVLVPLVEHADGYRLLLTERTAHLNDHPGQISFPGRPRRGRRYRRGSHRTARVGRGDWPYAGADRDRRLPAAARRGDRLCRYAGGRPGAAAADPDAGRIRSGRGLRGTAGLLPRPGPAARAPARGSGHRVPHGRIPVR